MERYGRQPDVSETIGARTIVAEGRALAKPKEQAGRNPSKPKLTRERLLEEGERVSQGEVAYLEKARALLASEP